MLSLPYASVKPAAPTSMVAAPSAVGVKVAVYTVEDVAAKSLKLPLVTVISPLSKSVVASLDVNVSESVASRGLGDVYKRQQQNYSMRHWLP